MAGLPGSIQSLLPAGQDELVRRMRDLERRMDEMGPSVAPSFSPVIADLIAKQAAIEAQVTFLSAQSFAYSSTKMWPPGSFSNTSGTGAWELQTYDPTYDDEYVFQASSTGILEIAISAHVTVNNNNPTNWAGTSRGYSLSWPGGSLAYDNRRSAEVTGTNCGLMRIAASNTDVVTVPSNATVTLRTCRAMWTVVAPETAWHGTRDTTVVVTRVGI
jgi:hypothetical protein